MSDAVWSAQGAVGPEGGEVFSPPHCSAATVGDWISLLKPRVILLVVFTGLVGLWVAPGRLNPVLAIAAILAIAVGAGAAGAINMWYDRDIDALMSRTRRRPIVTGHIRPENAIYLGIGLELISIVLLVTTVNVLTAVWSTAGFLFYVFIYTFWLKRRTPQNIVIGGAAGAFPPLVGWAAVTGQVSVAALLMFLIVFLWTPPHFWALALYKKDDYQKANIPMMPVVRGERVTKRQSITYAGLLLLASVALYATRVVDVWYLLIAVILGIAFLAIHIPLLREKLPEVRWARRTFFVSLWYMTGIFVAMVIGSVVH